MQVDTLLLWLDAAPHSAAENMALDEVFLAEAKHPWMRVYRWQQTSVSIGFSQPVSRIPEDFRHLPMVRRWTGGGVVIHAGDWTYTIGAPPDTALCDERAPETYRWIHQAMIDAMQAVGIQGAVLQPEHTSDGMGVCFIEPAKFDVVWNQQKIAGAAQRRNRQGFLHQGTIQSVSLPESFAPVFAEKMANRVILLDDAAIQQQLKPIVNDLVRRKYAADAWTQHRDILPV